MARLRPLLVLLVVLGLVLPRATAALAGLLPGGERVVVLCDGGRLTTVVLDAEGRPVERQTAGEPCGLLAAPPALAAPLPAWTPAERRLAVATVASPASGRPPATGLPPTRAPPLA